MVGRRSTAATPRLASERVVPVHPRAGVVTGGGFTGVVSGGGNDCLPFDHDRSGRTLSSNETGVGGAVWRGGGGSSPPQPATAATASSTGIVRRIPVMMPCLSLAANPPS